MVLNRGAWAKGPVNDKQLEGHKCEAPRKERVGPDGSHDLAITAGQRHAVNFGPREQTKQKMAEMAMTIHFHFGLRSGKQNGKEISKRRLRGAPSSNMVASPLSSFRSQIDSQSTTEQPAHNTKRSTLPTAREPACHPRRLPARGALITPSPNIPIGPLAGLPPRPPGAEGGRHVTPAPCPHPATHSWPSFLGLGFE